jgi:hypothetical protein
MTSTRALLVLAACTGSTSHGPIPLADLEHEFDVQFCASLERCGLMDDFHLCVSFKPSRGYYYGLFTDAQVQAALGGALAYDGKAATTCLDEFFSTCLRGYVQTPAAEPVECERIFVPSGAAGDACGANEECISTYCLATTCTGACCQGTCSGDPPPPPRPQLGESCALNSQCIASYCEASLCVPLLPFGTTCNVNPQCAPGMRCTNGVCLPLGATGDPCFSSDDCQNVGDYCDGTKCQPIGLTGAACQDSTGCGYYFTCDSTSKCVLTPPQALLPDGGSCSDGSMCESYFCDTSTGAFPGMCAPAPACF